MQKHISGAFETELDDLRTTFTTLGGLAEQQVNNSMNAFLNNDAKLAATVKQVEVQINRLAMELDQRAEAVLARRQPAATDLRFIVSMLKSSTDLERVGDEAERIAKFADRLLVYDQNHPSHKELVTLHQLSSASLRNALDSFARLDAETALSTIAQDRVIDGLYDTVVSKSTKEMTKIPSKLPDYLAIIWVARSLERISDHAKNISETVVYLVHGQIVIHNMF